MQKGRHRAKLVFFLVPAAVVVALDQASKVWVRGNLPHFELIPGFLNIVYVENYGSAFGLLANQTFLLVAVTAASLVVIVLFLRYLSPATTLSVVSIGLILGGAVGNLVDRLRFSYVTDFIDVHFGELYHWYAFNIADSAITVGIFVLIFSLYRSGLFGKRHEQNRKAGDSEPLS